MVNEENSILLDYDQIQIADRMETLPSTTRMSWHQSQKGNGFRKGNLLVQRSRKAYASMLKGIEEDEKNCSKDRAENTE